MFESSATSPTKVPAGSSSSMLYTSAMSCPRAPLLVNRARRQTRGKVKSAITEVVACRLERVGHTHRLRGWDTVCLLLLLLVVVLVLVLVLEVTSS